MNGLIYSLIKFTWFHNTLVSMIIIISFVLSLMKFSPIKTFVHYHLINSQNCTNYLCTLCTVHILEFSGFVEICWKFIFFFLFQFFLFYFFSLLNHLNQKCGSKLNRIRRASNFNWYNIVCICRQNIIRFLFLFYCNSFSILACLTLPVAVPYPSFKCRSCCAVFFSVYFVRCFASVVASSWFPIPSSPFAGILRFHPRFTLLLYSLFAWNRMALAHSTAQIRNVWTVIMCGSCCKFFFVSRTTRKFFCSFSSFPSKYGIKLRCFCMCTKYTI